MSELIRNFRADGRSQLIALAVMIVYLLVFKLATSDLAVHGRAQSLSLIALPDWQSVMFKARVPFQFEAILLVEGPLFTWLISPLNIGIGVILGALTGGQIALTNVARKCATTCGLNPATGLLAGLPGLLAGSACCAPIIFVLLGLQLTASLVTLMGLMVPIAFVLLGGGLLYTIRVGARRCGEAADLANMTFVAPPQSVKSE